MKNETIELILSELVSGCRSKEEAVVRVFERVRDIPYGTIGSRHPLDVYRMNRGTCSGKHFLLRELYLALGVEVKDMLCFHRYAELPRNIDYPPELKALLERYFGIPDFHNFIKVYVDGRWVTLDATFDSPLENYFVVNKWNGKSDTKLSIRPVRVWEVENPLEFKVKKIKQLPPRVQRGRELFLKKFSEWLDVLRAQCNSPPHFL
ncbi:transglutaminase domain-containing protein [Archaeoglobus veneficus]|uniref:Transglutaminase domain-containing protein n=1 Tax=Archaeoglobus veneficus (strain DSM 11195 / SNP6) TaxID=693661 RepID=F2KND0_ARCVS|nr:transglutaminase domain-containing protein [Archaeoglobus veneficus]AEA47332.1 transglutaminase domain-containing protein [Archaeoglobus veneficus SNP6]